MVARVVHRFGELLDRDVGRRDVGVAEREVDDVLACSPELHLQRVDLRERVRRQRVDAAEAERLEVHNRRIVTATRPPTPFPGFLTALTVVAWRSAVVPVTSSGKRDNPRRAALELLGMLVVAAALLAAPFVYASVRIEFRGDPCAQEVAAAIRHSELLATACAVQRRTSRHRERRVVRPLGS